MNALVEGCYAAARMHLARARSSQREAILAGLDIFRGGERGCVARQRLISLANQRGYHLDEALRIRANIRALRALAHATTEPPHAAPP